MTHLSKQQLADYRNGTLEAVEEYVAIEAHLATCSECRARLRSPHPPHQAPGTDDTLPNDTLPNDTLPNDTLPNDTLPNDTLPNDTLPKGVTELLSEEVHPDESLIARYARQRWEVPTVVAQHIAACKRCQEDVAGARAYQSLLTPAIWAEARAATALSVTRPGFGEWVRSLGGGATSRRAWAVGVPLFAVCLLVAILWWRSQPAVEIVDGAGRWTLTHGGQLSGPITLPPDLAAQVRTALQNRKLSMPADLVALNEGAQAGYHPNGTFVRTDMPTLRWQPVPEAASYMCTVTSPDAPTFKRAATKPLLKASWTPKKPLPRGHAYTWRVVATLRDGRHVTLSGSPRFKILEEADAYRLGQESKTYAASSLVLGLLSASAGVLEDANEEFATLSRANPKSEIVQAFYRQSQH